MRLLHTRDNADVNNIAFIKAFFEDFPGSIATKAADYTKIFEKKGFDFILFASKSEDANSSFSGASITSINLVPEFGNAFTDCRVITVNSFHNCN
jgi:hypothetical protein